MASDVTEHFFCEKQLYTGDVVGEDDDDVVPGFLPSMPTSLGPPGAQISAHFASSSSTGIGSSPWSSALSSRLGVGSSEASGSTLASVSAEGKVKRRKSKKAAERATKILYTLDSKYDILFQVCSSFENWKETTSPTIDFDLLWCDTAIPADRFMKLKSYQKMNHFVGMSSITRKNNLGRNLLRMRKQFPKEYKYFPDTWILPTDLSDFKAQFTGKSKTFIVKPDNGCQGKGIFLIRDVEKVPVDFSTTYVAQRYVHKPFLLDGYKFDLRLYVLVVGCDPLRIFLHKRGLVRLASETYVEPSGKNIGQFMMHLTNYAINKMNPNFEENTDPDDAQDGHKRSWEAVHEHLRREGHDVDSLFADIEDLIVKTLLAVQPSLSHFYHSCQPDDIENAMCFEVLGFDIILDQKLQPWLLEVNHAPSFATESELDLLVKREVLHDTFCLLSMSPEARRQKKRDAKVKMEQRAMGAARKQSLEERMALEHEVARQRCAFEDENLNGYKRLYPSEEKERKYMQIHDTAVNIWEMLMGGTSRRYVRLTQAPPADDETSQASDPHHRRPGGAAAAGALPRATTGGLPQPAGASAASEGGESGGGRRHSGSAGASGGGTERRTAAELREVVDRLSAGCSARPRASSGVRKRGNQAASALATKPKEAAEGEADQQEEQPDVSAEQPPMLQPHTRPCLAPRIEVQVGDIVKVQTNLGWESVTVKAKRPNGKIDIQFKDGEYMRAVQPRILREMANGGSGSLPGLNTGHAGA